MHLLQGVYLFGSPTTALFRGDVVRARHPFFEPGRLHEDAEVCYEILREHDFGFVHQILSFSRVHDESITGHSQGFNPNLLDELIILSRYGPEYLEPWEHATAFRTVRSRYLRYLGESWLRRREPEFWEYHRRGLATMGTALPGSLRLAGHGARAALHRLLSPGELAGAVRRRLGQRRRAV